MRVLHVFKTYFPDSCGGVERVIQAIAQGTAKRAVESHVLSLSPSGPGDYDMGDHFAHTARLNLHVASTSLSWSVFSLFRQLARNADIIHYHFPWPLMDLMHIMSHPGKPSIVTYHSDIVRQRVTGLAYKPLMRAFLSTVDLIAATSPAYASTSSVLQRYRSKVAVIPIGIPDVPPPASETLAIVRRRLGSGFFLFIGALRYYKGLSFLIESARATGLPVVIIGDGEMRGKIIASNLPNVTWIQNMSDAEKVCALSLCRAFVFPSHLRSEAFGVALLEAARAGKPMISCEIGTGTTFVNKNKETGLAITPASSHELSQAMLWIDRNHSAALQMGRRARQRYIEFFQFEQMAAAYHSAYMSVLGTSEHDVPTTNQVHK